MNVGEVVRYSDEFLNQVRDNDGPADAIMALAWRGLIVGKEDSVYDVVGYGEYEGDGGNFFYLWELTLA